MRQLGNSWRGEGGQVYNVGAEGGCGRGGGRVGWNPPHPWKRIIRRKVPKTVPKSGVFALFFLESAKPCTKSWLQKFPWSFTAEKTFFLFGGPNHPRSGGGSLDPPRSLEQPNKSCNGGFSAFLIVPYPSENDAVKILSNKILHAQFTMA